MGGPGVALPYRSEVNVVRRAVREGWPISPEIRSKVVEMAVRILDTPGDKRHVAAMKILLLADSLNVRREANVVAEHSAESSLALSTLRAALADPAILEQLATLHRHLPAPPPS